jgi:hypothetical protein
VTSTLARIAVAGGRPALTWYGDAGERVELSGAVLSNWVTKCANLLVEELDAGPGVRVRLDLPGHWRAVVWALAAWRVGACVVVAGDEPAHGGPGGGVPAEGESRGEPADVVVTADPAAHRGTVVAVALPALARRFDGALPPGAIDGAAVLGYGDALGWVPPLDPGAPALASPTGSTSHADLVRPGWSAGRVLLDASALPLADLLRAVLDVLAAGGSVVLVGGEAAAALREDEGWRERLVAAERIVAP